MKTLVTENQTKYFSFDEQSKETICFIKYEIDVEKLEDYIGLTIDWNEFMKSQYNTHSLELIKDHNRTFLQGFSTSRTITAKDDLYSKIKGKRIAQTKAQKHMFDSVKKFYKNLMVYTIMKTANILTLVENTQNCSNKSLKHLNKLRFSE